MIWNYHDVDKKDETANIAMNITGISAAKVRITEYRIDENHSNAYTLWKKMGAPQKPTTTQVTALGKAGQLQKMRPVKSLSIKNGELALSINLPETGSLTFEIIVVDICSEELKFLFEILNQRCGSRF